jgi:hypothetical protein
MTGIRIIHRGKGHSYTIDGEPADGVTTLIGDGIPKPALINWAANTTAGYAVDHWAELADMSVSQRLKALQGARYADLDAAGKRGTEVHGLAERLFHGEEVDVPEAIAGHVESCVRFFDEWKPQPVLSETVIGHRRWRYCGKFDAIADFPGRGRRLYDYKTARSGIYGETALQLSAYAHAETYVDGDQNEQPLADVGHDLDQAYGVWIRADGYDVFPLDIGADTFKAFLHVATVARRARTLRSLVGEALLPEQAPA